MATAAQKKYWAIKNALTPAQKALISYYELEWFLNKRVPTIEQVVEHLRKERPNLRQISVNYYLTQKQVIRALDQRGIPWRQHSQEEITDQQRAAALTVMNMMDTRSIPEKLDSIGVLPATYYAWLSDPLFKNFVDGLADDNKLHIRPTAVAEFTKKINAGSWDAIKYWLDATGEFANADSNMPKAEDLLVMLIEIIQTHVKDPETIVAIADDMQRAMANKTLERVAHPQLSSSPEVYDPELEAAKKQLGFG